MSKRKAHPGDMVYIKPSEVMIADSYRISIKGAMSSEECAQVEEILGRAQKKINKIIDKATRDALAVQHAEVSDAS